MRPAHLEGAAQSRRAGPALPGPAADGRERYPRSEASRQAAVHDDARSLCAAAGRPGRARLHRPATERPVPARARPGGVHRRFNHDRLHESLDDIPPVEFEQLHAATPHSRSMDRSRSRRAGPQKASDELDPNPASPASAKRSRTGLEIDERAAGGSLPSRYALAALTAGAEPTTIR